MTAIIIDPGSISTNSDLWKSFVTLTSYEHSCRSTLLAFLKNYVLIYGINEPILKNFHKAFFGDIISYLVPGRNQILPDAKIIKNTYPYFVIYPIKVSRRMNIDILNTEKGIN